MSGELGRIRKLFVEKVSLAVVKQLLDDLGEDRVLNDEERESVMEEHSSKADRARCLIDMVRKKGDNASRAMIKYIEARDPNLYCELKLQPNTAPTPSVPLPQVSGPDESFVSEVLIHATEQFKTSKLQEGNKLYTHRNKSERRRLALLINNVNFDNAAMQRRGAERDEERMEALLTNLGYDVIKHRDLSGKEMDKAVTDFSKRDEHELSDSTFVVMMSHGKRDFILGVHYDKNSPEHERDQFKVDNIYTHLNTSGCPGLRNKPKVILIQACRGGESGGVWVPDAMQDDGMAGIESDDHMEHKEKDFISLLSCTPDTKSYRHVDNGALFFQRIVEVFNTHAHKEHIEDLFTMVMRRFEDFPRQMVCKDRTTLSRHFYLFPGL